VANIALPEVFTLKIINFVLIYFVWGSEVGSIAPIEVEILFVQFRFAELNKKIGAESGTKVDVKNTVSLQKIYIMEWF